LQAEPAHELFQVRARQADARFTSDETTDRAVAAICARLDGLPLAIELAAGRTPTLSPAEILERLDARLPLLIGGPRDLPARQQTLRATLEWSFDQLARQARDDLAMLSVFAGGCTLDAATAVLEPGPLTPARLLELVDHSLLTHTVTLHGSRYGMLETVREFAAEHLEASGSAEQARRRHATYLLGFAESLGLSIDALAAGAVKRPDLAAADLENLRAALDWATDADPLLGLALMAALEQFWIALSPPEAAARLTALLDRAPQAPRAVRAAALRDLGGALEFTGDLPGAASHYQASLELYQQIGDEPRELRLVHRLVQMATYVDDLVRARRLLTDGLRRATAGGYRYELCEFRRAKSALELACGNVEAALDDGLTGLRLMREIGNWPWGDASMLRLLAEASSAAGRHADAARFAREGLALIVPLGDRIKTVSVLAALAVVRLRAGEDEAAGRLWGGIEAEEQRSFLGFWTVRRDYYANEITKCDTDAFRRGRTDGRTRPLAELIRAELSLVT
jgi:tetratricopeptide (TPR) repeat protein